MAKASDDVASRLKGLKREQLMAIANDLKTGATGKESLKGLRDGIRTRVLEKSRAAAKGEIAGSSYGGFGSKSSAGDIAARSSSALQSTRADLLSRIDKTIAQSKPAPKAKADASPNVKAFTDRLTSAGENRNKISQVVADMKAAKLKPAEVKAIASAYNRGTKAPPTSAKAAFGLIEKRGLEMVRATNQIAQASKARPWGLMIGAAIGGLAMLNQAGEAKAAGPAMPGGVAEKAPRGRETVTPPIGKPESESVPTLSDNAKRNIGAGVAALGVIGAGAGYEMARDTAGLSRRGRVLTRAAGGAGGAVSLLTAAVGAAIATGAHKRMQAAAEQGSNKERTDPYTDKLGRHYDKGRKITRQD